MRPGAHLASDLFLALAGLRCSLIPTSSVLPTAGTRRYLQEQVLPMLQPALEELLLRMQQERFKVKRPRVCDLMSVRRHVLARGGKQVSMSARRSWQLAPIVRRAASCRQAGDPSARTGGSRSGAWNAATSEAAAAAARPAVTSAHDWMRVCRYALLRHHAHAGDANAEQRSRRALLLLTKNLPVATETAHASSRARFTR